MAGQSDSFRPPSRAWAGRRVTFALLNAKHLLAKANVAIKTIQLRDLLRARHWPDIVTITELSGASGRTDVRRALGSAITARYNVVFTQRSVDLAGGSPNPQHLVGGGVALLVSKGMHMSVSEMHREATDDDRPFLDGHLRVWRLDPLANSARRLGAVRMPIVVTAAYIPPVDSKGWGNKVRQIVLETIRRSDEATFELQRVQNVFAVTMAHTNSPHGGGDLEMRLESLDQVLDHGAKQLVLRQVPARWRDKRRGQIVLTPDGRLLLRPCCSAAQASDTSKDGEQLMRHAASSGKLPLAGVVGHMQSTSWTTCLGCEKCRADRNACQRMHGSHDHVWVPDSLVWRALTCPHGGKRLLWQCVRRIPWSDVIDHAVTYGHFYVDPSQGTLSSDARGEHDGGSASKRTGPRRYHPPNLLSHRSETLRELADDIRDNLWTLLPGDDAADGMEVEEIDSVLIGAMAAATETARARDKDFSFKKGDTEAIRDARQALARCGSEIASALRARPARHKDRTSAHKRRLEVAHNAYRAARSTLDGLLQWQHACVVSWSQARAPKTFWELQDETACDPGAPEQAGACLLQHQNNASGQRTSSDPTTLRNNMREECASVHRLASTALLGEPYSHNIHEALAVLHLTSCDTLRANPAMVGKQSAVAVSAADPLGPMMELGAARNVRRELSDAIKRHAVERAKQECRGQVVQAKFPDAARRLNRDLELVELQAVFDQLTDVGPGVDGVSPVVLRFVEEGICMETMLGMFQRVFATGVEPESWRKHRMLFHYKGKNEDPYCLANYRVLGIDHLLLKIWSLLMVERLDEFIRVTKGLSVLQGGFQRHRGCPEQAFTLSETVRYAAKTGSVHLVFIDINKAYDRVIHPILWKKCVDRGVTGRFLASLQAIYHGAVAVVDVNGALLDPVDLQTGVLQGNPLSPMLFNIYIDDAIRELERRGRLRSRPYGISLPRCHEDRSNTVVDTLDQSSFIPCLFFADDGVILERDRDTMQELLDIVNHELIAIGLTLNVCKTKWMLVPQLSVKKEEYENMKRDVCRSPLHVGGNPIKLVDEFVYLGFLLWWRWSWQRAWEAACSRAWRSFFATTRGGWQNRAGSLDAQLTFAKSKIFCHFTYVAAVAGAGGAASSAPWRGCEKVVDAVLRAIAGYHKIPLEAMRIEAGIWDMRTRIDMLLMRMYCKFASSPVESPYYRALCLSIRSLAQCPVAMTSPETTHHAISHIQHQPWAQQLLAAMERLGVAPSAGTMSAEGIVLLQADIAMNGVFVTLREGVVAPFGCDIRLALRSSLGGSYMDGVDCWPLPAGTDPASVFVQWSPELKLACYVALKQRGNACRQEIVRAFLRAQVTSQTRLRRWASTISASFQQPYWRLADVAAARKLLRLRMDVLPNEDSMRCAPHTRAKLQLPRIDCAAERACYLCPCIDGADRVYWPETLEHVLLTCACPELVALRRDARAQLKAIAADPLARELAREAGIQAPGFDDDTELLVALQLCIGIGPVSALQAAPVMSADPNVRRASPQFHYSARQARHTAEWINVITADWCDSHRDPRRGGLTNAPGARLALFVARHAVRVFRARRTALRAVESYRGRLRDPVIVFTLSDGSNSTALVALREPVALLTLSDSDSDSTSAGSSPRVGALLSG